MWSDVIWRFSCVWWDTCVVAGLFFLCVMEVISVLCLHVVSSSVFVQVSPVCLGRRHAPRSAPTRLFTSTRLLVLLVRLFASSSSSSIQPQPPALCLHLLHRALIERLFSTTSEIWGNRADDYSVTSSWVEAWEELPLSPPSSSEDSVSFCFHSSSRYVCWHLTSSQLQSVGADSRVLYSEGNTSIVPPSTLRYGFRFCLRKWRRRPRLWLGLASSQLRSWQTAAVLRASGPTVHLVLFITFVGFISSFFFSLSRDRPRALGITL